MVGDYDFRGIIWFAALLGGIIVGIIWMAASWGDRGEVKSPMRLKPIRTELVIKNNTVDTLFVYKLP